MVVVLGWEANAACVTRSDSVRRVTKKTNASAFASAIKYFAAIAILPRYTNVMRVRKLHAQNVSNSVPIAKFITVTVVFVTMKCRDAKVATNLYAIFAIPPTVSCPVLIRSLTRPACVVISSIAAQNSSIWNSTIVAVPDVDWSFAEIVKKRLVRTAVSAAGMMVGESIWRGRVFS